jgi:sigma-B regulation protein RsbU (phosphoserine phosphatase)
MMPEMDGLELVRRIRSSPRPGYIYVILLTARSEKGDIVQGIEAGADEFLTKPFYKDELRVRLRVGERLLHLEQNLARRNKELETANQRMKSDLEAAARIQKTFLPTVIPKFPNARFDWSFEPCDELAGDTLNVLQLDDRHVVLYVLDVSGHGVAAAMLSVTLSRVLSRASDPSSLLAQRIKGPPGYRLLTPAQVARQLNQRFPWDPIKKEYFTLLYGILSLETQEFRYVSAGHPGPVYVPREAPAKILEAGPPAIGIVPDPDYREHVVLLKPGDRLYLYSDGVLEARNSSGQEFGEEGLLRALDQSRSTPLKDSLSSLWSRLKQWSGDLRLKDDVSLLAAEMIGPP